MSNEVISTRVRLARNLKDYVSVPTVRTGQKKGY